MAIAHATLRFIIRRTAFRALSAKPSASLLTKSRSLVTSNRTQLRPAQQWSVSVFQRRFASDEATTEKTEEAVAAATEDSTPVAAVEETVVADAPSSIPIDDATAGSATGFASRNLPDGVPSSNKLYVGNLFFEVSEQALQEHFARFGQIKSVRIVTDARGLSKGFAYVEFANDTDAATAIERTNQQIFQGRRMAVQYHQPRRPLNDRRKDTNTPSKTLFIGNMSFEMSDKDLSDLFREVRNVIDVRIAIDRRTGQPRGFAHADFIDVVSATKAREFLANKELYGRQLRVDYSQSTPRTPQAGSYEVGNDGGRRNNY